MIVTNLIGGLGNQLFQYACGHAVAARNGAPLRVATDLFEGYRLHQGYEVARVFDIDTPTAGADDLRALLGPLRHRLARRGAERLRPGLWCQGRACFEPRVGAVALVERLGGDAYLHGYWQSEYFFAEHADSLRQALRFRTEASPRNAALLARIDAGVSVGVHVRRGDYVANPKNRAIYAECSIAYYRAAIRLLRASHPEAAFYVFSDDPVWVRDTMHDAAERIEFVDHNQGPESYNDLRLMSRCAHLVMANSSFSWWAAWLGERPGRTVVAPRQWYADPARGADLIPDRWRRMDNSG
ncbi:MAG: alpha-1,2-fucosyltransferase [Pseudomonadota bacterium]|nr:alpha-1,2-fucosyltransferase [Pseudomonadota bacterium]